MQFKYKAIIFDFNGTLLWDTPLHNRAWDEFLQQHRITMSDAEKDEHLHGKTNRQILNYLFDNTLTDEQIYQYGEEKEAIYRDFCIAENLQLADGITDLFDLCRQHAVPIAIATSSNKSNVDFFIEHYNLLRWFDARHIVYNDGIMPGKPSPDIFLLALSRLGHHAKDTIVFEDSSVGIQAAQNAKVGKIIVVNSSKVENLNYPHTIVESIRQFDVGLII